MQDANITWYVEDSTDSTLVPSEEYYAGTFVPNDTVTLKVYLWNNRWGTTEVASANDCKLVVYFETIEDSTLLSLCKASVDGGTLTEFDMDGGRGVIDLNRSISGAANNGSLSNTDNYSTIILQLGPITDGMKNSLKTMYLSPDFNSGG